MVPLGQRAGRTIFPKIDFHRPLNVLYYYVVAFHLHNIK